MIQASKEMHLDDNAGKVLSLFASNDHGKAAMRRMSRDKRSMLLSTARSFTSDRPRLRHSARA